MELNRRTFAIISHPDAGKTTLTEKLLLEGGAIHVAGEVKAKGERRRAHSDWLAMEQKRGISITSSVMTFEHKGLVFNLLDTPGHKDFSEDTYRTLTAVDAAIMVLDAAKGIEAQTLKLFEVCRLRDIPIITYVNKMDRECKDPFDLLEEIKNTLALDVCPMTWPIGSGDQFQGVQHLEKDEFIHFSKFSGEEMAEDSLSKNLSEEWQRELGDAKELIPVMSKTFDTQSYEEGHLTPVVFGSALKNFGVNHLLQLLTQYLPKPGIQKSKTRDIRPDESKVSGFVFKIQANMDPNHRDRIAFFRLCSGIFKKGMKVKHTRSNKTFAVQAPVFFLARERALTEEAYPGDILGIPNHGKLRIGDTLTEGEDLQFVGIPSFAPEIFRRVRIDNPMDNKKMRKAMEDLSEEGVSQLFKPMNGGMWTVGVVGQLQLDVLEARAKEEYKIDLILESAPFEVARWISAENKEDLEKFMDKHKDYIAHDLNDLPVYLARSKWDLQSREEDNKRIIFNTTREQY